MMKKYVKPEIEALALETIDVIATSDGYTAAAEQLVAEYGLDLAQTTQISEALSQIKNNQWSW